MAVLFLTIIYVTFISLGLPDSIIGATWPLAHDYFGVNINMVGYLSVFSAIGTIISGIISGKVLKRYGTGMVTFMSTILTAISMLLMYFSSNYFIVLLLTIPLGLGAGAIDAGLNSYVANNYKASHMNWLHCCWGIGVTISPLLASYFIKNYNEWKPCFLIIAIIQFLISFILLLSLKMWKKETIEVETNNTKTKVINIKGVKTAVSSFYAYCALESILGPWGPSYLVKIRGMTENLAAIASACFFFAIAIGRMVAGFIANRISGKVMIRIGQILILIGTLLIVIPSINFMYLVGFFLVGFGCAPIYPMLMHATPKRFRGFSQTVIGYQIVGAYLAFATTSPIISITTKFMNLKLVPYFLFIFLILLLIFTEYANRNVDGKTYEKERSQENI